MKKVFFYFSRILLINFLILTIASCEKDEKLETVPDPQGTITSNISTSANVQFPEWSLSWISPNNFSIASPPYQESRWSPAYYVVQQSVCHIGKVNGLGNIKDIPQTGFTQPVSNITSIACEKGHGYIIKVEGLSESQPNGEIYYVRLYVSESLISSTSGGIMGAKIKYQYPFEP